MASTLPTTLGLFKNTPQPILITKAQQILNALGEKGVLMQYIKHAGTLLPENYTPIQSNCLSLKLAHYYAQTLACAKQNEANQEIPALSSTDHSRI
jgi:hypothetical protein